MPWIAKDRIGEKFGAWTIIERMEPKRPIRYNCKCDCGYFSIVHLRNLVSGKSSNCIQCGALKKSKPYIGSKFYYLTILDAEIVDGIAKVKTKCDCGNIKFFPLGNIQKTNGRRIPGKYRSCGECQLASVIKKKNFRCLHPGFKKGKLTIIKRLAPGKSLALCDCGNEKEVKVHHMQIEFPSCGCHIKNIHEENARKLEGTTFYNIKVLKFIGMGDDKRARYLIKCKCGKKYEQSISHLFGSKSCGCLQKKMAPKGSQHSNAKLSEADAISMREFFNFQCYTRKELAEMYGISYEQVCLLLRRKSWKHV